MCQIEKEITEFNFKNKSLNAKDAHCKSCQKIRRRKSYLANRDYYLSAYKGKVKDRRINRRGFILSLKDGKPCADCKTVYPHYVMDFDHLPQFKKEFTISNEGEAFSEEKILKEVSKCELVCSNCHRIRTWNRKNNSVK